jgi:hypothetical protein
MNWIQKNGSLVAKVALLYIVTLFVLAYPIKVAYNTSIPLMNSSWKPIDYTTSFWFTVLISVVGMAFMI